jgi:hypothetical protein
MQAYVGVKVQTDCMTHVAHVFVFVLDKMLLRFQWLMRSNFVCHYLVPQFSERKL